MPRKKKITIRCSYGKLIDIDEVKVNPRNPNEHSDEQIDVICRLLKEQGWRLPLTVSKLSGLLVRGHGRLLAAKKLDEKKVPVDLQKYDSAEQENADLLADNFIAEMSSMNDISLKSLIMELNETGYDMALTAIESGYLGSLLGSIDETDNVGEARDETDKTDVGFAVVIECDDESHQIEVLDVCEKKGWKCRALI